MFCGYTDDFGVIQQGVFKGYAMTEDQKQEKEGFVTYSIFPIKGGVDYPFDFQIDIPKSRLMAYEKTKNLMEFTVFKAAIEAVTDFTLKYVSAKTNDMASRYLEHQPLDELGTSRAAIGERAGRMPAEQTTSMFNTSYNDMRQFIDVPIEFWEDETARDKFSQNFFNGLEQMRKNADTPEYLAALQTCGVAVGTFYETFLQDTVLGPKLIRDDPAAKKELFDVSNKDFLFDKKISDELAQIKKVFKEK
jgi:hypothetical protein